MMSATNSMGLEFNCYRTTTTKLTRHYANDLNFGIL